MAKSIFIYKNHKQESTDAYNQMISYLKSSDFWDVKSEYDEDIDYLVCIGGDGTFLSFVHKHSFPKSPILGINTGHLGFFQEILPTEINKMFSEIENNEYSLQKISPIEATINANEKTFTRIGINEILIRGQYSHVSHFELSIGKTMIQNFSGDGLLISTPVGSTAYNYSLDGSLVSPDLNVLQITPVAPMNTNPYRCFHSSILLPATSEISITGTGRSTNGTIILSFDGKAHEFYNVNNVKITQYEKEINLIRYKDYNYWSKLSNKLL